MGSPANLFQEFWTWRLVRSPEFATLVGNDAYGSMLEIFTKDRFKEDLVACKSFAFRADTLLQGSHLSDFDRLNLKLLTAELDTFIDGFPFQGYFFPVNFLEGVQVDFQRLADWMNLEEEKDFENLIDRYGKFDQYADQIIAMMKKAIREKYVNHACSMEGVLDQFEAHQGPCKETAFWTPFENLQHLKSSSTIDLQSRACLAIKTSVQPGMKRIAQFIKEEYMPMTRKDIGATTLPNGKAFYEQCLKFHTSTNMTAQEIHDKGIQEVERIEGDMRKVIEELGHKDMTIKQFSNLLRMDKQQFFNSPEELLDAFNMTVRERITPNLASLFWNSPALEFVIQESSKSSENAPAAYYIQGTPDGKRKGTFFVNTNKYKSQPKYEVVTLSLHEANPGHHLQASFSLLQKDLPKFRTSMEDRIYSQAPTRFPINTAYVEGWGLYSEKLGFDLGLYDDLYDRYGHYSFEIFRACRLVVDTGMHAMGWSKEKAINYMLEHTASSEEHITDEINRYITWPGQACGYKIGELKISELRQRATTALGTRFDIRDFHEVVLKSSGPLYVLEEEVDQYIRKKLQNK